MRRKLIPLMLATPQALLTAAAGFGLYALVVPLGQVYDDPDARQGLLIGAVCVAVWMVASLVAVLGLCRRRHWARWLAVAINLPIPLFLSFEWLVEGEAIDSDEWPIILVLAAIAIFYALPVTGRRREPAA